MVSRSIAGSESPPLPTMPGHIALCKAGNLCVELLMACDPIRDLSVTFLHPDCPGPKCFKITSGSVGTGIFDLDSLFGCRGRYERLILSKFAKPNHGRSSNRQFC